jgi:hypothetical protein
MGIGEEESRDPRMLRVSHADRDRVVEILREAAGEGRLEPEELEQRVEAALTARTFADLEPLTADLPAAGPRPRATPAGAPGASGASARPVADAVDAVDAAAGEDGAVRWDVHGLPLRREGAWSVPPVLELHVSGGTARLDYSQARLPEGGSSLIRVQVHGGAVRLSVPGWIAVDSSGVQRFGRAVRDRAARRAVPGGPVTHVITLVGQVYGGSIKVVPSQAGPGARRARRLERHARILGHDRGGRGLLP